MLIDRIYDIIKHEDSSPTKFAETINCSRNTLADAYRNKTDISSKWIVNILTEYTQYSAEWLMRGEGSMLKEEEIGGEIIQIDNKSAHDWQNKYLELEHRLAECRHNNVELLDKLISKKDVAS